MSKTTHHIKAVIFDMDGVITNTMPDHHRAWKVTLDKYGIPLTHEDVYTREGQPGDEALVEIFAKYKVSGRDSEIPVILREKEEYFKEIVRLRFIPKSRTLLRTLHKRGIHLALVTGTARHELKKILPDSLASLFSVVVTGTDVTNGKPHPEPFLKALKHLAIPAHEAVVIENAPYGIRSAKSAGLKCIALETSLSRQHLFEADHIFESMTDLNEKVHFELIA